MNQNKRYKQAATRVVGKGSNICKIIYKYSYLLTIKFISAHFEFLSNYIKSFRQVSRSDF